MSDPEAHIDSHLPANAEDRKAAAALSALNTNEIGAESESPGGSAKPVSSADREALGKAMSRLEIAAGGSKDSAGKKTAVGGTAHKGEEGGRKKAVKVAAGDVTLLVEELDLSKVKATELLKANEGDVRKAIKAFIMPLLA